MVAVESGGAKIVASTAASAAIIGLATEQWLVIGVGLVIGIVARWAYLMSLAQPFRRREAMIDLMMAPMNGALAAQMADSAGVADIRLLMASAMCGAGSTVAFVYTMRQFNRLRGKAETSVSVFASPGSSTEVPASAPNVVVEAVDPEVPSGTKALLVRWFRGKDLPPSDDYEKRLLEQLDRETKEPGE